MTRGFRDTGRFHTVFAVEADPDAAESYALNFGQHVVVKRIEMIDRFPEADVVVGGPPCQGFSPLNMRSVGFERRSLWRHYLRALEDADPLAFVMENVPQLLGSAEYREFKLAAESLGFGVDEKTLNAADFGVPQTRKRAIVIGSRVGEPRWPTPTHCSPKALATGASAWRTFRDAVVGLPLGPDGRNWHVGRNPRPISIERYRAIPGEGEGRFELARRRPEITPDCWLRKTSGSTDVFGRLWWDRPALTIRTEFFKPEKGRYLHPSEHRSLTIREGARLMSIPDDLLLPSSQSMTSVGRQIGNAVPPLLAKCLGDALADQLDADAKDNMGLGPDAEAA